MRTTNLLLAAACVMLGQCVGVDAGTDPPLDTSSQGAEEAPVASREEPAVASREDAPRAGCAPVALELIRLVNAYRAEHDLPAIPASPSLCTVAAAHTHDLAEHDPHTAPGCNLHSWSASGRWSACCYTPDHAASRCMWQKPRELTAYPGIGYENAYVGSDDPADALASWRGSEGHDQVILNHGSWAQRSWRAIGADVHGGFAVLWFGEESDPAR